MRAKPPAAHCTYFYGRLRASGPVHQTYMEESVDTHWFKDHKKGLAELAGKALRVGAAGSLLVLMFGPLPLTPAAQQPQSADAKSLEWGDYRGPMTDDADS